MKSDAASAPTRPYRQRARAEAAEDRTQRILDAGLELFGELPYGKVTLAQVADRAGVGLQTLIRRVGTKEGLLQAIVDHHEPAVRDVRGDPGGDPDAAAAGLERQYERWGELNDRMARQRDVSPVLADTFARGVAGHAAWVDRAFADALAAVADPAARGLLRAQLIAVCGLEVWLVLRRDHGLSAADTRTAVAGLLRACLSTTTPTQEP